MPFIKSAQNLLQFINNSPTAFHAVNEIKTQLITSGFKYLNEGDSWNLEKGGKYFVTRNDSALIAFIFGSSTPENSGYRIIEAHTDSPSLIIKYQSANIKYNYSKVAVAIYGTPIISTWLDRDLSIAGRVIIRKNNKHYSKLVDIKRAVAIIPNLAIHLNSGVNNGFKYDKQNHLKPIFSCSPSNVDSHPVERLIAEELDIDEETIIEADLFLYNSTPGSLLGKGDKLIVSGRLDNLAMTHATLDAILAVKKPEKTAVAVFYDNEEVGSLTPQGAESTFLRDTLQRIAIIENNKTEAFYKAFSKSFMISADMAHAIHPNFPEKHDSHYTPVLNGGPVIKVNSEFRYATTGETAAYFDHLCDIAKVPYQKMINRSDMRAGTTVGPMSAAMIGAKTVDVGNPMLAMHSIRETAGAEDHLYMIKVFQTFYNMPIS